MSVPVFADTALLLNGMLIIIPARIIVEIIDINNVVFIVKKYKERIIK